MVKCPKLEADGHYKNFGEVLQNFIDLIGTYNDCAARHDTLVDFVKGP